MEIMYKFGQKHVQTRNRGACLFEEGIIKEIKKSMHALKFLLPIIGLERFDFGFEKNSKRIRGTAYFPKGGTAKVLAFDAGLKMGTRQLQAIALPLARAGYAVFSIYPPLEVAREEAEDYITALEQMKRIFDARSAFFVGISSGAAISLLAASAHRFSATVAIAPYANLAEMYYYAQKKIFDRATPKYVRKVLLAYINYALKVMKTPETAPDEYAAASPINFIENLKSPTLIIHGVDDKVVPPKNSVELYEKAKASGKDIRLKLVFGESVHADESGYFKPLNALGLLQTIAHSVEFLCEHSNEF